MLTDFGGGEGGTIVALISATLRKSLPKPVNNECCLQGAHDALLKQKIFCNEQHLFKGHGNYGITCK